jgi:hypothetical protein
MEIDWLKNLARLYLPVYQIESDSTRIAYAGYSLIKKNYYVHLMLDGNNHSTFLGRRWFWQLTDLIKSYNLDMVISEISPIVLRHFQKSYGYIVPGWAMMRINIDRSMSEICHRSVSDFSDVKRKIRKYNLTYEMLTKNESICYFYDKFYLPYITKRHGEEAWIEDLKIIENLSQSPLLIAIKENGAIVGMGLINESEGTLYLMRLGLLDGNDEYRHHGVIGAIYYFSIIEGKNMGCRYLDIGGTRPFLTDGLTRFKIGLGAEFVQNLTPEKEYLWLGINEHSIVAKEFKRMNPFMHVKADFSLVRS